MYSKKADTQPVTVIKYCHPKIQIHVGINSAFLLMINFVLTPLRTCLFQPSVVGYQVCASMPGSFALLANVVYPPPHATAFTLHTARLSISTPALHLGSFSQLSSSDRSCYGSTAPVKLDPAVAGHSTDLLVSLV